MEMKYIGLDKKKIVALENCIYVNSITITFPYLYSVFAIYKIPITRCTSLQHVFARYVYVHLLISETSAITKLKIKKVNKDKINSMLANINMMQFTLLNK